MTIPRAALLAALAAITCKPSGEPQAGLGKRVFSGPVRALSPSPDGASLAFLDGCTEVKAQFLPPQTARCDLRVVASAGGEAVRVATGVTTLPQGVSWSPDGKSLVAMADYDHAAAAASLVLWEGAAAQNLADSATFYGYDGAGQLGYVTGGQLWLRRPGGPPRHIQGADGVATFEAVPHPVGACGLAGQPRPGILIAARRTSAAGGGLLAVGCFGDVAVPIETGLVGDYGASGWPAYLAYTVQRKDGAELKLVGTVEGAGAARTLARAVQGFAFAPSARSIAFVADVVPGRQGNLHVAGPDGKGALLARDVGEYEYRWAAKAPRLAWLEKYDARVRAGTVGFGGPGLAPRAVAPNVSDFDLSPDGKHLAYLQHTTRGGYSVDLAVADLDAPKEAKPRSVARGVFGFAFSPDGQWLYYRTRCVRNAEACDLERVPAAGLPPGGKPESIAPGVKSFEFDPRDPGRLLVTWQRMDMVALDVAVWSDGKLVSVDTAVLPGSARFLGPDSRRVAYAVADRKRQGVYVADLSR